MFLLTTGKHYVQVIHQLVDTISVRGVQRKTQVLMTFLFHRNCVQCHHSNNASQAKLDQCKTSCAYLLHYIDQTSECFSGRSYFRVFSIIFIVTFLIGLLVVLIIRQIILQGNSNKVKSSADYRVSATKKDKMFLPTVCTRTVTYRRDKPEEINIDISKLRLNETFKCEF